METKNFDTLNDMILGPSGVGKTVFLSSLFQGTVNSCIKKDDCFVNLNSRSENGDNDMISSVVNAMGSARSYTTDTLMGKVKGTIAKINFNFDININDKNNCFVIPTHLLITEEAQLSLQKIKSNWMKRHSLSKQWKMPIS